MSKNIMKLKTKILRHRCAMNDQSFASKVSKGIEERRRVIKLQTYKIGMYNDISIPFTILLTCKTHNLTCC